MFSYSKTQTQQGEIIMTTHKVMENGQIVNEIQEKIKGIVSETINKFVNEAENDTQQIMQKISGYNATAQSMFAKIRERNWQGQYTQQFIKYWLSPFMTALDNAVRGNRLYEERLFEAETNMDGVNQVINWVSGLPSRAANNWRQGGRYFNKLWGRDPYKETMWQAKNTWNALWGRNPNNAQGQATNNGNFQYSTIPTDASLPTLFKVYYPQLCKDYNKYAQQDQSRELAKDDFSALINGELGQIYIALQNNNIIS